MAELSPFAAPCADQQTDRLAWGVVEFQVTDLERAAHFWCQALGLAERERTATSVTLGSSTNALFVLHSGASKPVAAPHTGMFHVAIGVRSQFEFSRTLARLMHLGVKVGPTDHLMAKSLYLTDPDGLEIEITMETPERFGSYGDMSKGLILYDAKGRPHNGRGPLDISAELAHAENADLLAPIASDAYVAHLHFKVASLEPALQWYETLGFSRHLTLSNWGFADMGAGVENTHRLAMNIWAGQNHPPAPDDMARLVRYELIARDAGSLTNTDLQRDGNILKGTDPTGVELVLRSPIGSR